MGAPRGSAGPLHRIRISNVTASIWQRTNDHGTFHDVTLQKAFKRSDSDDWDYSETLGRDDLLTACKVLDWAHSWIVRHEAEQRQKERQA